MKKGNAFQKRRGEGRAREPGEFEQKLLDVRRVARVTAGGKRFSFRTVVVVGDRLGRVGVGVRKGQDVRGAVEKSVRDAKKNLIQVVITSKGSIPHEVYGKSSSARIFLKPAPEGRGIIAGGAVRTVVDLAGYKNIIGKILSRSGNKLNNGRAAIEALKKLKSRQKKAEEPSISAEEEVVKADAKETDVLNKG